MKPGDWVRDNYGNLGKLVRIYPVVCSNGAIWTRLYEEADTIGPVMCLKSGIIAAECIKAATPTRDELEQWREALARIGFTHIWRLDGIRGTPL